MRQQHDVCGIVHVGMAAQQQVGGAMQQQDGIDGTQHSGDNVAQQQGNGIVVNCLTVEQKFGGTSHVDTIR